MHKKTFRILSYNIHKGFTSRNRSFVLREIRDAIHDVHADIVFLQEVLGEHSGHRSRHEHWPSESQFEFMAGELWPHFAYGRNAIYDEGHHGNAILSKYPILEWENEDVSTTAIERRGLLHAVIDPFESGAPMHLICIHFGLFEGDRQIQAKRLCNRIASKVASESPVIVAGDFNDWTLKLSPVFKKGAQLFEAYHERHNRHARTFPAKLPILRLDRIYCRSLSVRMAKVLHGAPWVNLSDHAPLLAELEWA